MKPFTPIFQYAAMLCAICSGPPMNGSGVVLIPWCLAMRSRTRCASAGSSRMTTHFPAKGMISFRSRPTSTQCFPRTASLCAICSVVPKPCHMSAYRAVVRRVRCSPPPPMRIGRRFWTGRTRTSAFVRS